MSETKALKPVHFLFPTICLITGHAFGGASVMTLVHDYRVMNTTRRYCCMLVAELGLHFDRMGALLRTRLSPQTARRFILQGHNWRIASWMRSSRRERCWIMHCSLTTGSNLRQDGGLWNTQGRAVW
ncbi:hypothetical protein LB505_012715 [Fusarium chuoi]|nr:hypothetical protein LB505_012715 [Fusarium chuoi]